MKCPFCKKETQMTVKDSSKKLYNCCLDCKDKINGESIENGKDIKLTVSCVWKASYDKNYDIMDKDS